MSLKDFLANWDKLYAASAAIRTVPSSNVLKLLEDLDETDESIQKLKSLLSTTDAVTVDDVVDRFPKAIARARSLMNQVASASKRAETSAEGYELPEGRMAETAKTEKGACQTTKAEVATCKNILGTKVAGDFTYLDSASKLNWSNECDTGEYKFEQACKGKGKTLKEYFDPNVNKLEKKHKVIAKRVTSALFVVGSLLFEAKVKRMPAFTDLLNNVIICEDDTVKIERVHEGVLERAEYPSIDAVNGISDALNYMQAFFDDQGPKAKSARSWIRTDLPEMAAIMSKRLGHISKAIRIRRSLLLTAEGCKGYYYDAVTGGFNNLFKHLRTTAKDIAVREGPLKETQARVETVEKPEAPIQGASKEPIDRFDSSSSTTVPDAPSEALERSSGPVQEETKHTMANTLSQDVQNAIPAPYQAPEDPGRKSVSVTQQPRSLDRSFSTGDIGRSRQEPGPFTWFTNLLAGPRGNPDSDASSEASRSDLSSSISFASTDFMGRPSRPAPPSDDDVAPSQEVDTAILEPKNQYGPSAPQSSEPVIVISRSFAQSAKERSNKRSVWQTARDALAAPVRALMPSAPVEDWSDDED